MKSKMYIALTIFCILTLTIGAYAEDNRSEIYTNYTYNTLDLTTTIIGVEVNGYKEEIKAGTGFNAGYIYWINDWFGMGAGYDHLQSFGSEQTDNYKAIELDGLYAQTSLRYNELLSFNLAVPYYNSIGEDVTPGETTIIKGKGPGLLINAKLNYPLYDNLSLEGFAGYRLAALPIKERIKNFGHEDQVTEFKENSYSMNFSGYSVGIGLNFNY